MHKQAIKIVQIYLKDESSFSGMPDGIDGPATEKGVLKVLHKRAGDYPAEALQWPHSRRMVLVFQLVCEDKKIPAKPLDGYWGPTTQYAYDSLIYLLENGRLPPNWRDTEITVVRNPNYWPRDFGKQSEMRKMYGTPGRPAMTKVPCPWTLRLAWDKTQTMHYINCHSKVAASLSRVLQSVYKHYGAAELKKMRLDLFGGCYSSRNKRGGSNWSTHAWAVAIDWDPERNQLKWSRARSQLADADYEFWWDAWEAEGWVSLGRERNYDWMHVQAARL